jgi:hypothetical protein
MALGLGVKFAGKALGQAIAPQLAKWGPKLKAATPNILPFMPDPANPTWRNAAVGLALDAAPETLFAGMLAAQLPEGTPFHERAGAFVQDAAIGTAIGTVGTAGLGAGLRRSGLSDQNARMAQMATAPMMYLGANALMPRPFEAAAYSRAERKMVEEERARRAAEDERLASQVEQNTIGQILGGFQR